MPVRVLVVDDSGFFRRRLTEMLTLKGVIEVVDTAVNGLEGVEKAKALRPDVVVMDIEMPVMDGISAVRRIMRERPVPILMFSSLTHEGAQATLDALEAGAADFLPKKFEDISKNRDEVVRLLQSRIRSLAKGHVSAPAPAFRPTEKTPPPPPSAATPAPPRPATPPSTGGATPVKPAMAPRKARGRVRMLVIGTSTGGPVALQKILTQLAADFPVPILVIQHMPASFTPAFASRLDSLSKIRVKEAADGDTLEPGAAYLAPGGKQMLVESQGTRSLVRVVESAPELNYRPSVDVTFGSVARLYPAQTLALVLTGMGADGREGARLLRQGGSQVWAQDEASCVIYGMPQAIVQANLADKVVPLQEFARKIQETV